MEKNESDSQIIIKLIILDIFPSLEEVSKNFSEIITIIFQGNDIIYNLYELMSTKKELDLLFPPNSSIIKILLNKNNNLYASGLLPLKNHEQWVTLSYENKKPQNNLALSLIDCIKLKIKCKIIAGKETVNILENNINNINVLEKKNKLKLNNKKMTDTRKLYPYHKRQESFNTEENMKSNRIFESEIKPTIQAPYTTINKNNIQKIELPSVKNSKLNKRKTSKFNYTTLKNEELKNLSLSIPSNSKNSFKITTKKNDEMDVEKGSRYQNITTEVKSKTKGEKRSFEDINYNLNLNIKNNKSFGGIQIDNSSSYKNMKKRKSGGIQQVNINSKLNKGNNNKRLNKENLNYKKNKSYLTKTKNIENDNNLIKSSEEKIIKSSRINSEQTKNLAKSTDMFNNNEQFLSLMNEFKKNNENNIDHNEIVINYDVENITEYNLNNKISDIAINVNNDLSNLEDEQFDNNIFEKQLEDFRLLYSDEYIKSINNDYMKLEIELFIEKIIELTSLYNNQIEEKNFEYQIVKNNYFNNISLFIEMQKLCEKLRIIKTHYDLKKYNIRDIKSSHYNNSINNLITNKQEIRIFKSNFIDEMQKEFEKKKENLRQLVKKLLEKDKIKKNLEKNEKFQIWIKDNCKKKDDKKKKEKYLKNQKLNSSKKRLTNNYNNINSISNKKINTSKIKSGKNKYNKMNNEEGKSKSIKKTKK